MYKHFIYQRSLGCAKLWDCVGASEACNFVGFGVIGVVVVSCLSKNAFKSLNFLLAAFISSVQIFSDSHLTVIRKLTSGAPNRVEKGARMESVTVFPVTGKLHCSISLHALFSNLFSITVQSCS